LRLQCIRAAEPWISPHKEEEEEEEYAAHMFWSYLDYYHGSKEER
jgi:hypothetical protein